MELNYDCKSLMIIADFHMYTCSSREWLGSKKGVSPYNYNERCIWYCCNLCSCGWEGWSWSEYKLVYSHLYCGGRVGMGRA